MVASVGRISAGTGYEYLAKEVATSKHDYYAGRGEAPGRWAGTGSADLSLEGRVDEHDMEALYGRFVDPRTSGRDEVVLGRKVTARTMYAGTPRQYVAQPIAALDVTFSPSKSVSALWATHRSEQVRQIVLDAHDFAVKDALGYLEDNAGHTRTGAGGLERIDTNGFVVAAFRHRTARSTSPGVRVGDPQLHTHCAILNRIHGVDGVWRTLDSKAIYRHAHTAGALYGAVLERELTARLGVDWATPTDGPVPMREIVGIPDDVIAKWSSRRRQVLDTYDLRLVEFRNAYGRSPTRDETASLKDAATLESRLPKASGVSDLHTEWRNALTDDEVSAIDTSINRVESSATTGGRRPADDMQLRAEVTRALENRQAWWTRVHVYREIATRIDQPTRESIELATEAMMLNFVCLEPDDEPTCAVLDATRFTSQRILDAEHEIIEEGSASSAWTVAPQPDNQLGSDQVHAVEALTAIPHQLTTVIGPAGAGKTTMLRSVAASYRSASRPVCVLTLSAAAARVVTEETGLPATTIASWQHGMTALPHRGLVLIDEASMVPTLTLRDLARAARAHGCRVGLVGDYAQMGSPEAGGLLRDLAALPSAVNLTAVRRFTEAWERRASVDIQERDHTTAINYLEHGRIRETTTDYAHTDAAEAWFADHQAGLNSLVVTDTNHDAADVSASCQRMLDCAGLLGDHVGQGADHNMLRIGDQIQTRHNTSDLATSDGRRVLNRDVWTITGQRAGGTVIAEHQSRNARVFITPEYRAKHTVLAYATTIAGAQGRTVDTGHAVITPRTTAASLYVGMTRGRIRNHAHVITDCHDHEELQLGHRSGLRAFADAILRNAGGDTSATTVKRRWVTDNHNRTTTRNQLWARQKAERWWTTTRRTLPNHVAVATERHEHAVVAALAALPPESWRENVLKAARSTDWQSRTSADDFVARLGRTDQASRTNPPSQATRADHTYQR